ncbi:MAG: hypothetical protein ACP5HU_06975 [Phycisphaerae bacterium]
MADSPEATPQTQDRREGGDRRGSVVDRRSGIDRRRSNQPYPGLERRRGPGRRRSDTRRAAEEGEMTDEQFEFIRAIDEYKRINSRPFPTWTEVLDVIKALGYRKVAEPRDIR